MFTGLIEHLGVIASIDPSPAGQRIVVDAGSWQHHAKLGDSISVNGCCLTVAEAPRGSMLAFDVIPETLAKTTLGTLARGKRVHLEPSATASTLLGGHIVQGHVDGVAEVLDNGTEPPLHLAEVAAPTAADWRLRLRLPVALMEFAAPKGSIAIDGVSLTIAVLDPREHTLEIALIPTTLEKTTLGTLRPGDSVNVECDTIAKTVVHWLKHFANRNA